MNDELKLHIYDDFTEDERSLLTGQINNYVKIRSSVFVSALMNSTPYEWAAVYVPWLIETGSKIILTGKHIYLKQTDIDYYYPTNTTALPDRIPSIFQDTTDTNKYEIVFINTASGIKVYDYMKALTDRAESGYINYPEIAVALTEDQKHKVKVVRKGNTVFLLSNNITEFMTQAALALVPHFFSIQDLKDNENINNICKAVTKNQSVKPYFTELIKQLQEVKKTAKYTMILNMLNKGNKDAIESVQRQINNIKSNITSVESRLENYFADLEKLNIQLLGYQTAPKANMQTVQEILDYVDKHRYIKDFKINQSDYSDHDCIRFFIQAPITLYETEPLRRTLKATVDCVSERTQEIYKAFNRIFLKEEYQMICETLVEIDPTYNSFHAIRTYSENANSFMFQPHLSIFDCWGENKNIISKELIQGNLLSAINSMLIATQNINFTDSAVFNRWIDTLRNHPKYLNTRTVLDKQTGSLLTLQEVIEIAKDDPLNFEEV